MDIESFINEDAALQKIGGSHSQELGVTAKTSRRHPAGRDPFALIVGGIYGVMQS